MHQRLFALVAMLLVAPSVWAGPSFVPQWCRLRATDASGTELIQIAWERSEVVRALVEEIEHSQVTVYVSLERTMPEQLAGRMSLMGATDQGRFVRVSLNRDKPQRVIIATLAHELTHVRELIANPGIVDQAGVASLYRRIGLEGEVFGRVAMDTERAQRLGFAVRREIARR